MSDGKNSKGQFEKGYQPFNKGLTGVNGNCGRTPHFKTPEELETKWKEFVELCKETNEWINKDKFCLTYGYYCNLFNEYIKKPNFSGILATIDKQCKNFLLEKGLRNEYNSAIVKLIMSADYNMSEKAVFAGDKDNPIQIISNIKSKKDE